MSLLPFVVVFFPFFSSLCRIIDDVQNLTVYNLATKKINFCWPFVFMNLCFCVSVHFMDIPFPWRA